MPLLQTIHLRSTKSPKCAWAWPILPWWVTKNPPHHQTSPFQTLWKRVVAWNIWLPHSTHSICTYGQCTIFLRRDRKIGKNAESCKWSQDRCRLRRKCLSNYLLLFYDSISSFYVLFFGDSIQEWIIEVEKNSIIMIIHMCSISFTILFAFVVFHHIYLKCK